MKAALNGVLNLSVLDGWWIEACIEGLDWLLDRVRRGRRLRRAPTLLQEAARCRASAVLQAIPMAMDNEAVDWKYRVLLQYSAQDTSLRGRSLSTLSSL
jgi:glucan phosphorylase